MTTRGGAFVTTHNTFNYNQLRTHKGLKIVVNWCCRQPQMPAYCNLKEI